ncbi:Uma2 family endonuclease [Aeoliella mucimassa]|uniref:Putative restriction endonuclease domain-containing protein n=1 Tax=Aeoliella mucimassa TaxID=2527972 RepID=A0A518AIE8_9BACT|nr:Uma2 family endonuclease [Aeoliella mucimassa]QDU54502.1 hypothetical protein Pan181_06840 [Aeoliella mucimassa]
MSIDSLVYATFDQTSPHTTLGPHTADDYLSLPEGERVELLRGRLTMMSPAPTPRHQHIGANLWRVFDDIAAQQGGIAIVSPVDVVLLQRTIAQPDVVYLRPEKKQLVGQRIEGVPDLLVEIVSPSSRRIDRVEKLDLYAKAGVPEYWIVDPDSRIIEFHTLDGESYRVVAHDSGKYQSAQFAEVVLDLTAFWQEIDRRLPPKQQ